MRTTVPISESWVDILPPQAPRPDLDGMAVGIGLLLLVIVALAIQVRRRPRLRARRELRHIGHALRHGRLEARPAGVRVRRCLCQGLGRHRLRDVTWDETQQVAWRIFLQRLDACCFSAAPPGRDELAAVVSEALTWLDGRRAGA